MGIKTVVTERGTKIYRAVKSTKGGKALGHKVTVLTEKTATPGRNSEILPNDCRNLCRPPRGSV